MGGCRKASFNNLRDIPIAKLQRKRRYRNPDVVVDPVEALRRLVPYYSKVGGSRAIGPHLSAERNVSHSFAVFVDGIRGLRLGA